MTRKSIWQEIEMEVRKSRKVNPVMPEHLVASAAIVGSAAGDLMRVSLQWKYQRKEGEEETDQINDMRKEAIHTAAMAIRFLESLK